MPALTVAVVIPAYNAGRYLGETLAAIAAQTRLPDEVIIVDDGSVDQTLAIAHAWAATWPGEAQVLSGPNGGQALARNRGILASRSDAIALLDADDVWLPGHLTGMMSCLEAHPSSALVFCDGIVIDDVGHRQGRALERTSDRLMALSREAPGESCRLAGAGLRELNFRCFDLLPSLLVVPRETFARVGLFDARLRYTEDVEFIARALTAGPSLFRPEPTVLRRVHEAGISRPGGGVSRKEAWLAQTMARILDYDPFVTATERVVLQRALEEAAWEFAWEAAHAGPGPLREALTLGRRRLGGRNVRGRVRLWLAAMRSAGQQGRGASG